jgi:hypothetical protein
VLDDVGGAQFAPEVPGKGEEREQFRQVSLKIVVPGGGIEPPQAFWALRILSPLRLPISPSRLAIILA